MLGARDETGSNQIPESAMGTYLLLIGFVGHGAAVRERCGWRPRGVGGTDAGDKLCPSGGVGHGAARHVGRTLGR